MFSKSSRKLAYGKINRKSSSRTKKTKKILTGRNI